MYRHVADLFVAVLEHDSSRIKEEWRQKEGGVPDLIIKAATEVLDKKENPIMHDWAVVEVKDEPDAFCTSAAREKIFNEKAKYIVLGTEYFVMIDPSRMIVRPVALGSQLHFDPAHDIELAWKCATEEKFCKKFERLHGRHAEELSALREFRNGDISQIAAIKVDLPEKEKRKLSAPKKERLARARNDFLNAVRQSTVILQNACTRALENLQPEIKEMERELDSFAQKWGGEYTLQFEPVKIFGKNVQGMDEQKAHGKEARKLSSIIRHNQPTAKLAARALPAYFERTGNENTEPFALESANLILARILLLRFFEDREFFNGKKFICNGGVAELQRFMQHRERGYAVVLETAYQEGAKIYADAFDYTDLDWVLKKEDRQLSNAVELAMFYFSRFDFSTVSGDILTGIYDRFLDRDQRKAMGEFYTPPSVSRYILQRLNIKSSDVVFDPACGSGTFLLEAFACMTKGDISGGRGNLAQAEAALANIGGNDLNPFSAVMARIQFLWHLLPLKEELKKRKRRGEIFPEIRIDDSYNSLLARGLAHCGTPFEYFDESTNDVVIGNPPYVRPERAPDFADMKTRAFFAPIGGADKNLYDLFTYKALAQWCKKAEKGQKPGRLGFVIPLSFCDSKNSAPLRKLFALGGQFRIIEILDMETIAPHVFDAAVNPIILFAENRPAKKSDKITIRIAGESCIINKETREFNFTKAPAEEFNYAEIWTPDGRILTKTNPKRQKLIAKMNCGQTLADIARSYWTGRKGRNRITKWRADPPEEHFGNGDNGIAWEEKKMLALGASFRRQWRTDNAKGMDFYKGENIRACRVEGEPVKRNILPNSVSSPSLWKYRDILPPCGYAFLAISLGITAARFNPRERVFTDTSVLLFPNKEWENFPIDAALLSRIFQFYCAVYLRKGVVSNFWSHLYPDNLEMIPWHPALKRNAAKLEKLRAEYLVVCENINSRAAALNRAMEKIGAVEFAAACRAKNISILWSERIQREKIKIDLPAKLHREKNGVKISLDKTDSAWFVVGDKNIAARAAAALTVFHGTEITRENIRTMNIPKDAAALEKFKRAANAHDKGGNLLKLAKTLDAIDAVVGGAFGLSATEIKYIQKEMETDDFLRRIRPNMPFSGKRQRGSLAGLDSPSRYGGED